MLDRNQSLLQRVLTWTLCSEKIR